MLSLTHSSSTFSVFASVYSAHSECLHVSVLGFVFSSFFDDAQIMNHDMSKCDCAALCVHLISQPMCCIRLFYMLADTLYTHSKVPKTQQNHCTIQINMGIYNNTCSR